MDWIKKKEKKRIYFVKMLSKEYLNKKAQLNVIGGKKRRQRKLKFKYLFIYDLIKVFNKKKAASYEKEKAFKKA